MLTEHNLLHERIAALRKAAGLSQEALAAELGVSRQAIGKWESGASLPGIDNLQALAAELHVSCDELLTGQKPDAGEKADRNMEGRAADSVSAAGVAALLEAESGARAQSERRQTRALIIVAIALTVVCAALAVCGVVYSRRLDDLSARLSGIDYRVSDINTGIDARISSIQHAIENGLSEQANIVASFDWQYGTVSGDRTIPLTLTAAPKTFREGMTASMSVVTQDGTVLDVPADMRTDGVFTSETTIPLTDSFSSFAVSVHFTSGGETQTQMLFNEYDFVSQFLPDITVERPLVKASRSGSRISVTGSYDVTVCSAYGLSYAAAPTSAEVRLLVDGEPWPDYVETPDLSSVWGEPGQTATDVASMSGGSVTYHFTIGVDLPPESKLVELAATVTDAAGFTATDSIVVWQAE